MNTLPKATMEALAFEEKILPSGLCVRVRTMPGYDAAHVIYGTRYGSINGGFEKNGETVWVPAGTAHFLEHKLFENEDGVDAFTLYAETGASGNAYTSFDRTCYIFTATSEMERNLDILLGFVGHPHFTEVTVQKEQGIIGQEIGMYQDNPDTRLVFSLLEAMYSKHPVREDIVGSVESIASITPELLYKCTDAFYDPGNMVLAAAGNVTMGQLLDAVKRAGLDLPRENAAPVKRLFPSEPDSVAEKERRFKMPVAMPQFGLGFKEKPLTGTVEEVTKAECICELLGEMICGETSPLYRRLYDEGLVQPGFGADAGSYDDCLFFFFTGEGNDPDRVRALVLEELGRLRSDGVDEAQFATCKRMLYGDGICELDSVDRVASMLATGYFRGRNPAAELEAIASLEAADMNRALQSMLLEENSSFVVIEPLE